MPSTRTVCPYCGVGCGVIATPRAGGGVDIAGDPDHPANFGRLCSKGAALGETLSLDDRLLQPMIAGKRATWSRALDLVATRFTEAIRSHGPDSVALYVSGQILIEDYYVANKFMKGFIGSANIDTNSRLCMASSVAGHKRAFGSDTVPGCYEDLEEADLVVLVGSNLAWCHPVLFQRLAAAREKRGTKVVVLDPRRTETCEIADLHLALAPGSDVALFNGLLLYIAGSHVIDRNWISAHTIGFSDTCKAAARTPFHDVVRITGLSEAALHAFFDLFVSTERVVTIYSQGVNQSTSGTDKVNAIINCHLATGRIGRPGMGPFSVTGQPNAMGGRETGGLATTLAAHMDLDNAEHRRIVQAHWVSPRIAGKPGLKAVDLFRAVKAGRIRALWIMATNPVDSMPEADDVRGALEACPFVVVSEVARHTDTTSVADVLLPSLGWGEKSGTVTNSERRISRQRAFLPRPGEAKADWWQLAEVARRMGFADAFAWKSPHDVFVEHARLTATDNDGKRDLDLGDVATLSRGAYDAMQPFQWPRRRARIFGDGRFFTPDGKARFVPTPFRPLATSTSASLPFVLNTGRVRDQWHTMTRTGKTPRLTSHIAEPYLEIHPDDAQPIGLGPATIAQVSSPHGMVLLRVLVTKRQRRGSVFAPIHWTAQVAGRARVDAVVAGHVDPVSGQPELKATPVAVKQFPAAWYGFAVSQSKPVVREVEYWVVAPATNGWRVELAGAELNGDWDATARTLLNLPATADLLSLRDRTAGHFRCAGFDGERLLGALFVAQHPVEVSRAWAAAQLGHHFDGVHERLAILSGRPASGANDKGAIVCACFDVGCNQIIGAIASGCSTVAAVGTATSAGTSCGSCRTQIARMLDAKPTAKTG